MFYTSKELKKTLEQTALNLRESTKNFDELYKVHSDFVYHHDYMKNAYREKCQSMINKLDEVL